MQRFLRWPKRSDRAAAGGLLVFGIGILFIGLILTIFGFAMDSGNTAAAFTVSGSSLPVTQEQVDTLHYITLMFKSCAILIPIGFGFSLWANSTRTVPGEV